jgi:ATP-dependent Clp protease adapter protein ClpS
MLNLVPVSCCCRTESSKKKPPIYKVMLHNDNYNRREYVVKILLKTVEGLTVDDAVNVMQVGGQCQWMRLAG